MQELFSQIFKRNFEGAASEGLLMNVTAQYPWFTLAHFFLLQKTEHTSPDYKNLAARTALLFNNPFLLNYRLKEEMKVEKIQQVQPIQQIEKIEDNLEEQKTKDIPEVKPGEMIVTTEQDKKDEMIFEPLFATDYFASQGIKLSEEVQNGDKLGKQLKSFTEWLKSMKKIHESKAMEGNEQIDTAVQNLAEKSNQEADVLTESMVEAYLQQGKRKKALETLEKLSLLNPSKSAYFAAKIESIAHSE